MKQWELKMRSGVVVAVVVVVGSTQHFTVTIVTTNDGKTFDMGNIRPLSSKLVCVMQRTDSHRIL